MKNWSNSSKSNSSEPVLVELELSIIGYVQDALFCRWVSLFIKNDKLRKIWGRFCWDMDHFTLEKLIPKNTYIFAQRFHEILWRFSFIKLSCKGGKDSFIWCHNFFAHIVSRLFKPFSQSRNTSYGNGLNTLIVDLILLLNFLQFYLIFITNRSEYQWFMH